jgi:hypothetical protein
MDLKNVMVDNFGLDSSGLAFQERLCYMDIVKKRCLRTKESIMIVLYDM